MDSKRLNQIVAENRAFLNESLVRHQGMCHDYIWNIRRNRTLMAESLINNLSFEERLDHIPGWIDHTVRWEDIADEDVIGAGPMTFRNYLAEQVFNWVFPSHDLPFQRPNLVKIVIDYSS